MSKSKKAVFRVAPRNYVINPTARLTVLSLLWPGHWDPSHVMQVLHLSSTQLNNILVLRIYTESICHNVNAAEQLKNREMATRRSLCWANQLCWSVVTTQDSAPPKRIKRAQYQQSRGISHCCLWLQCLSMLGIEKIGQKGSFLENIYGSNEFFKEKRIYMEISVTIGQRELQCRRTWKECTVKIKTPINRISRRISYTCLLPHLANLLERQQLLEKLEELGKVLVVTTTMNCYDLSPRSIWMTGIMKILLSAHCCILNKKLQTTHFTIQKGFWEELQIREMS